jgi:hypothetical protein
MDHLGLPVRMSICSIENIDTKNKRFEFSWIIMVCR